MSDCRSCEASVRLCDGLVAQGSARCCADCQHEEPTPVDPAEEVTQAFAVLRRHLPASLRHAEAELEAAWFNGGPLPVDWPTRFHKAADVAEKAGWAHSYANLFRNIASWLERDVAPDVVEAIGRALLGQEEK